MPTITFQVNLENPKALSFSQPYTQAEAANFKTTRVAYFPDLLRDNRELKHGAQFTVSGLRALYLRDNFTTGEFKFLDVVSVS